MATRVKIMANFYRDSVSLMQLAASFEKRTEIRRFSAFMASKNNIDLLIAAKLLSSPIEARPNDLLLAAEADNETTLDQVMHEAEIALNQTTEQSNDREKPKPRSIAQAVAEEPDSTLALIATPGEHAASEAWKALRLGLHVMLFSDNVSLEDEVKLKKEAAARGLIVMGPDCGTAIIDGTPLAFANAVQRGPVGIASASGTGAQHVCCHLHALGQGVSHVLGTGGRDLNEAVGGISMLTALDALQADSSTRVAVIISKPPAPSVMRSVLSRAGNMNKPVVVLFLGAEHDRKEDGNIHFVNTLEEAGLKAFELVGGRAVKQELPDLPQASPVDVTRRFIRGIFSGGTFCYEASVLLGAALPAVTSNTPVTRDMAMADIWKSEGHCLVDLGDDVFTRGRPHPMIDQRLRCARLIAEAQDQETAVILFDVVLGYGAHADPASELVEAIFDAKRHTKGKKSPPAFISYVCGTDLDPQSYAAQCAHLVEAGVILAPSNTAAVRLALNIVTKTA